MKITGIAATLVAFLLAASPAVAQERGTAAEAITLTQKTVALLKTTPAQQLYAEINSKDARFIDRDLYVFIQDYKGLVLAHAINPKLVGKDASENQDVDGKFYVKERLEMVKTQKAFWHDYKFSNPTTKKIETKSVYCEARTEDIVCVGIYKQ